MLKRLRWQLTLLYMLAALGLLLLVGAGSYTLLRYYFIYETDQALDYKMAQLFEAYSLPLPQDLSNARQAWLGNDSQTATLPSAVQLSPKLAEGSEEDDESSEEHSYEGGEEAAAEEYYDASLAPIFTLTIGDDVPLKLNPNVVPAPMEIDKAALQSALVYGLDRRTVQLPDGTSARLLSYRMNSPGSAPAVFQIGRLLSDQEQILERFLSGLLLLGSLSVFLLGGISWLLSGRSISPAQTAWDQQQTFIANASHELRTPLTLIRATAEYGLRSQPSAAQATILKDIIQENDYMNRLVDDLLLLSRLDTHQLELKRERIDLSLLLVEIQRQMEKIAGEKGVQIMQGDIQGSVWGDPTRLRQVLLILLDNALRYTPPAGIIRMETRLHKEYRRIYVADTGSGIPAQYLEHVFERFYQVPRPGGDNGRSNGLGLSIAKSLTEAQGGSITIESQLGKGTTIIISLPDAS
jgi:signal transduction histidine kinase